MSTRTHDILVVASWFPSIADPVAGRFVADQVAALRQAGCRVQVASFDPADLFGSGPFRARLAEQVEWMAGSAHRLEAIRFSGRGSESADDIPVARLPIPNGRTPRDPILHGARHRTEALGLLGTQLRASSDPDDRAFHPALIHAHTGYPDGVAAAALADALDVPLLITEHATFLDRQFSIPDVRAAYLRGALRAHKVLAVSRAFATELQAGMPEIADRVGVMPNTVDIDSFRIARAGERRSGELLFVGYWKEIKGIDVLLRALAIVRERRPDATLRLVGEAGDPDLDRRWRSLAEQLGVATAVTFEPPMDRAAVAAAMCRADIFVHASRRETFGVVAAEALAAGLPVVATDSGGVTEILGARTGGLGLVVPRDDPEAFAGAILDVLDHRGDYDQERLRAGVVERFGAAAVARRLVELYEDTIANWAGSVPASSPRATTIRSSPGPNDERADPTPSFILVAFDPDRVRVLGKLPPAARASVVLVTSTSSEEQDLLGFHQVVLADLHDRVRALADARAIGPRATGWRRVVRVLRHPLATARRRGLLPGLEAMITGRGGAAIGTALNGTAGVAGGLPVVVCADGVDYFAARPLIEAGRARAAPGGLRWLADQLSSR